MIGVLDPDDTMTATQGRQGLRALNMMTGLWSLMPTTSPVTSREVFDLVANQGGPDNPYTIGPSGDFDTTRPQSILAASYLQYPGTAQEIEVPRAVITTDAWQQISVKQLRHTPTISDRYSCGRFQITPTTTSCSIGRRKFLGSRRCRRRLIFRKAPRKRFR
jgi:hypothetical protein